MFRKILIVTLIFTILSIPTYAQMGPKEIRKDLEGREFRKLVIPGVKYEGEYNIFVVYVEPKGIIISINKGYFGYEGITKEGLNSFFSSIWRVFGYGISKYPPTIKVNFYIQLGDKDSLIVEFPIGALLDFFKEKITRAEFLKQCEIWINGEKAVIEGDVIKVLGKEFKMDFTF
ncbi:MAG: hypothetical protein ACPLSN_04590 [Dictyoglomus turgidum]